MHGWQEEYRMGRESNCKSTLSAYFIVLGKVFDEMEDTPRDKVLQRLRKRFNLKENASWKACIKYLREKFGITAEMPGHEQLILLRAKLNLTQEKLAELVGVEGISTVHRWEKQERNPEPEYRQQLFDELGIPVDAWSTLPVGIRSQEFLPQRTLHQNELPYPPIWNVPIEEPLLFVGRDEILEYLHEALLAGKTPSLTQAISGLGGIGKTMTAVRYTYKYRGEYQAVLWCEAESKDQLRLGFVQLARVLKLPEQNLKNTDRVIQAVQEWMKQHAGWLLILDNVELLADVYSILPTARRGHVIITTRTQEISDSIVNIELDQLTPESGATLLLQKSDKLEYTVRLEDASKEEQEQAKQISQDMGGLPLALQIAGAYMKEEGCDLQQYAELYRTQPMEPLQWKSVLHSGGSYAYPHTVATVWSLSFEHVRQANIAAAELLSCYSYLAPDDIINEHLLAGASELGPYLSTVTDSDSLKEIQADLLRYSLITRHAPRKSVSVHRLVQTVYREQMDEPTQKMWKERVVKATYRAFIASDSQLFQHRDRYISHAQLCLNYIMDDFFVFPEAFGLLMEVGRYLRLRALYTQSESFCMRALTIVEQMRTPFHSDRAMALGNVGHLRHAQGRYEEATSYFRQAVRIWKEKPPKPGDEALYATSLSNVASGLIEQGKIVRAEQYALQAVNMMEHIPYAEPFELAFCLNVLAVVYREQEKYSEAEALYQRALTLHEQQAEPDMVEIAHHLTNLASMGVIQGKYEASESFNRRALALIEKYEGRDHPDAAKCLTCLSDFYVLYKKDFPEAERLNQQALEIYKSKLGQDHPDVFEPLANLAILAHQQGKYEQAEILYQQVLLMVEKYPFLDAEFALQGYALLLTQVHRPQEAKSMLKRAQDFKDERKRKSLSLEEE